MRLRCASAPQFFDRMYLHDDRVVWALSPSGEFFLFYLPSFFVGFLFFF